MVTFPEMPARMEQANLTPLTTARLRQLAETDPDWPIPLDEAPKVGRTRLFDWRVLEPYFRERRGRQGHRTDRLGPPKKGSPSDATPEGDGRGRDE